MSARPALRLLRQTEEIEGAAVTIVEGAPFADPHYVPFRFEIARAHGCHAAAVFGRIERFAAGAAGTCYASYQTIGDDIGLSRATVAREVAKLIAAGLLVKASKTGDTLRLQVLYSAPDLYQTDAPLHQPATGVHQPATLPKNNQRTTKEDPEPNGSGAASATADAGGEPGSHAEPATVDTSHGDPPKPSKAGAGVDVYRSVYRRYPRREQYDALNLAVERLGAVKVREAIQWWATAGHRPTNILGMIEVAEFGQGQFKDGKLVRPGQVEVINV